MIQIYIYTIQKVSTIYRQIQGNFGSYLYCFMDRINRFLGFQIVTSFPLEHSYSLWSPIIEGMSQLSVPSYFLMVYAMRDHSQILFEIGWLTFLWKHVIPKVVFLLIFSSKSFEFYGFSAINFLLALQQQCFGSKRVILVLR